MASRQDDSLLNGDEAEVKTRDDQGESTFGRQASGSGRGNTRLMMFWVAVTVSEFFTVFLVAPLVTVWCAALLKGDESSDNTTVHLEVEWTGGYATFNWHPLMMTWSFAVILIQSMLAFRGLSRLGIVDKDVLKRIHFALHLLSLLLICIGLAATFDYHSHSGTPHLTTMHSWLGLMTVLAFVAQFGVGFAFYCTKKGITPKTRKASVHWHKLAGISILVLSASAIATGILEAAEHHGEEAISSYPDSAVARVGQAIGILLPFPIVAVGVILTKVDYRRRVGEQERPLMSQRRKYNN